MQCYATRRNTVFGAGFRHGAAPKPSGIIRTLGTGHVACPEGSCYCFCLVGSTTTANMPLWPLRVIKQLKLPHALRRVDNLDLSLWFGWRLFAVWQQKPDCFELKCITNECLKDE